MVNELNISVVIPLYNKENAIVNTLNTVLAQTYSNFECVIVNDGSTDHSREVVESWISANQNDHFRLINKPNGGVSSARNRGIQEAKYEYIALLDGDDLWDKHFLEEQVKLIHDFPDASLWGVNYAFIKGDNMWVCNQGMGKDYRGYVQNYFGTRHNDLYCSNSVVLRKCAFMAVGMYDERIHYSEDLDLWYRLILNYPVVFYDKVLSYYNQNAENRCAYDLNIHHDLTKCYEFYLEKFNIYFDKDKTVSHFINDRVAQMLLKDNYYFGDKKDRKASNKIIQNLRYKDIHPKYRIIFQTPRCIGWIVYRIVSFKKRLWRQ